MLASKLRLWLNFGLLQQSPKLTRWISKVMWIEVCPYQLGLRVRIVSAFFGVAVYPQYFCYGIQQKLDYATQNGTTLLNHGSVMIQSANLQWHSTQIHLSLLGYVKFALAELNEFRYENDISSPNTNKFEETTVIKL